MYARVCMAVALSSWRCGLHAPPCASSSSYVQVCEYENVCLDLPGPAWGDGQGYASQTDTVAFVGSDIVPSYTTRGKRGWPQERADIAKQAPAHCLALVEAAINLHPWDTAAAEAGAGAGGGADCQRWLRHFLRLYPLPDNSIPWQTSEPYDRGFDAVFEDIPDVDIFQRKRLKPFGAPLHATVRPPLSPPPPPPPSALRSLLPLCSLPF